jgi:hypothetical protein
MGKQVFYDRKTKKYYSINEDGTKTELVDKNAPTSNTQTKATPAPAASSTPNADAQIAKAEADRVAADAAAKAKVEAERSRLAQDAQGQQDAVKARIDSLMAELAAATQPDYAAQYQELYQSQLDEMKSVWETQRQQQQADYEARLAETQDKFNTSQEDYKNKISETQGTINDLRRQIEFEKNDTGQFDASVFNPEQDKYATQAEAHQQGALTQLQELMKVYAFDPAMQKKIQDEYSGRISSGYTDVLGNTMNVKGAYEQGLDKFQSGQFKLSELPSLYGAQTAFNQSLQAKQQGLITSMQGLANIESDLQRRVKEDAANIQSQRLAEKQSLQSRQAQNTVGKVSQSSINQGASRNVKNIQSRGLGTGLLSNYFKGVM